MKIAFTDDHVFFARTDFIYFFKIGDEIKTWEKKEKFGQEVEVLIREHELNKFKCEDNFHFKNFFDIGNGKVCMVVEN